jgi:hypothetical protein
MTLPRVEREEDGCFPTLDMGGKEVSEPGRSRKFPRVVMFTLPSRLTIKLPMRPYRGVRGSGGGSCCNRVRTSHSTRKARGNSSLFLHHQHHHDHHEHDFTVAVIITGIIIIIINNK